MNQWMPLTKTKYEVLDPLPRWAYSDSEWSEMITSADKIVDGIMYQITEPEALDEFEVFLDNIED